MGKTLYIQRLKEHLESVTEQDQTHHVIVPVHGPKVTYDSFVESLKEYKGETNQPIIFHIDISPSVSMLFYLKLLVGMSCEVISLILFCAVSPMIKNMFMCTCNLHTEFLSSFSAGFKSD